MTDIYKTYAGAEEIELLYGSLLHTWPAPNEQRWIETPEGPTFVVSSGAERAPPVLLLHGSLANSATWLRQVGEWSADLRLHAVDMIGEPGRSAPARPPLASDRYARWLDAVVDGLGVERAALVGISLGGWLALDFAVRRPDRAGALALIAPGGIGRQRNVIP